MCDDDSEGGIFNCKLKFPETYPDRPPKMKFVTPIWHPNVYPNGDVCISILHEPGEDSTNPQETAAMRWNPIHTVSAWAPDTRMHVPLLGILRC